MRYIVIEVTCRACHHQILTPADADMEMFRMGYQVHLSCVRGLDGMSPDCPMCHSRLWAMDEVTEVVAKDAVHHLAHAECYLASVGTRTYELA